MLVDWITPHGSSWAYPRRNAVQIAVNVTIAPGTTGLKGAVRFSFQGRAGWFILARFKARTGGGESPGDAGKELGRGPGEP
jgi:hypothetical protein